MYHDLISPKKLGHYFRQSCLGNFLISENTQYNPIQVITTMPHFNFKAILKKGGMQ